MRRYTIACTTRYTYSSPAQHGHHMVRMVPVGSSEQQLHSTRLEVSPTPTRRGIDLDFFANPVDWFSIDEPHTALELTMLAEVEVSRPPSLLSPSESWQSVADAAAGSKTLLPHSPAHFLRPTQFTIASAPLRIFAARHFSPGASTGTALESLNATIHTEMTYDGEATQVETTASQAFTQGAGVCQDFAHIMIAACRCVGVPARYVSGYIRTTPPPGQPRLEGADAMHAWVSVWTGPSTGWIDYDPTNGCHVGEDHISVAIGRDYQDTTPVRGEVVGSGEQNHSVAVDVLEVAR